MKKSIKIGLFMVLVVNVAFRGTLPYVEALSLTTLTGKTLTATVSKTQSKIIPSDLTKNKPLNTDFLEEPENYIPGEILVKYKDNKIDLETFAGRVAAQNFAKTKTLEQKENLRKGNISVLKIKDNRSVEQKIAELKNNPNVEYAEPNYRRELAALNTDDTYANVLWGLDNTGQSVNGVNGSVDKDIDAPEAWAINEGSNGEVIVAIIDIGVAYNHPDLAANMWNGLNCKDENGNALGECNHGYDFETGDKTPLPTSSSHGTHVAGTIAATKNNTTGVVGVAPNAKIMAIKFDLDVASEVKAIDFATQNGAKIINASYGGNFFSQAEYDAINRFKAAGGIFVTAAGNYYSNNDVEDHFYPSDYDLTNIISVAATDQNDELASFSNYGTTSVDVGAPGTNIYSTEGERVFEENFKNVIPPEIGTKLFENGNESWGTINSNSDTVIWTDYSHIDNYRDNVDSIIKIERLDLSGKTESYLNFDIACNSEKDFDYVYLYFGNSAEWTLYTEYSGSGFLSEEIPLGKYVDSEFRFKFRWLTNFSNIGDYQGCLLDNIKIIDGASSGESYQFLNGTSMAAPHVAGLTALIMGYQPTLTIDEVKNVVLTTGDSVSALNGKTVTGKRINAFNALNSLVPADTTAPTGTIAINNGATHTNSRNVNLTLSATDSSGVTHMQFNNGTGAYSEFEAYATTKQWKLSQSGDGEKTVRVKYKDAAGNITETGIPDTIILDTVKPVITLNGDNLITLTVGDPNEYTDAGAMATEDLTASIVVNNPVDVNTIGEYTVTYNVTDLAGNVAIEVTRTVIVEDEDPAPVTLSRIDITSPANKLEYLVGESLDITGLEVTGTYSDSSTMILEVTLDDVSGFDSSEAETDQVLTVAIEDKTTTYLVNIVAPVVIDPTPDAEVVTLDETVLTTSSARVAIAENTVATGPEDWNGVIDAPTVTTVEISDSSTLDRTVSMAIEIGSSLGTISFDKGVRILLPGQAGKKVGYKIGTGAFTEITATCANDSQEAGDALPANGECKIDVGSDLVIWTKHFTTFATYTETVIQTQDNNGGGGGGSGSSSKKTGDINKDSKVDRYDFALLMANWTFTGSNVADLNKDSKVDRYDFALLMSGWN